MDFNQIAVFVKVVQAGSFSAAARLLNIPVSTVSNRVAMLEKRLGMTLLQRTTRQLHLTDAGKQYYTHAAEGLAHIFDAESSIFEAIGEPCGVLRISAPFDIGNPLLSAIIDEMNKRWPEVKLEFVLIKRYMDLIAEGIDVAIRTGDLDDSTLIAKRAGYAEWQIFASQEYVTTHPEITTPQDIRHHCCLQFTPMGRDAWTLHNADTSLTILIDKSIVADDISLIKTMTMAGKGIALLPDYQCNMAYDRGGLVRLLPDWYAKKDPIHLIYPRHRYMSPKLRAFIDIAHEILKVTLEQGTTPTN
ncbi:LysR family transcriptional regulator [Rosenbergiella australiborealis]|uniref:LysR family transcriptional regulator n=1 Tax=Rosenbergiella australiborealis TaxID=1544696 RepID=A0ABS5T886_9GAMM|nr:LysR family transcriptional regulator [Rosenbergiella australiborealis]MBT0727923.1 LysR family transcriptional regulator [Rosenbergiella australiborealis]